MACDLARLRADNDRASVIRSHVRRGELIEACCYFGEQIGYMQFDFRHEHDKGVLIVKMDGRIWEDCGYEFRLNWAIEFLRHDFDDVLLVVVEVDEQLVTIYRKEHH